MKSVVVDKIASVAQHNNLASELRLSKDIPCEEGVLVAVEVLNYRPFYILGEVLRTGEYPLVKHLTVLQAFALAGGFTECASKKEIILLRHEGGKDKIYRINYKDIAGGKDFSQNLKLKTDDTNIVP